MQTRQESSVVFSLRELERLEETRQEEERASQQEQLAVQAAQRAESERLASQAAKDSAQVKVLREMLAEGAREKLRLQEEMKQAKCDAAAEPLLPLVPTVEFPSVSSKHHWAWAGALVFACLGVYGMTRSPVAAGASPQKASVIAEVKSPPAPEPALSCIALDAEETPLQPVPALETPTMKRVPTQPRRGRGRRGGKDKETINAHTPIDMTQCKNSTDPLCGLEK